MERVFRRLARSRIILLGEEHATVEHHLDSTDTCDPLPKKLASAKFVVEAASAEQSPPKPRLGVFIEGTDSGVRVIKVYKDSVAAQSGIIEGDVIQAVAGLKTTTSTSLVEIIQRQAPGTWLPLQVKRGGESIELLAKFPQPLQEKSATHLRDGQTCCRDR